MIFKKAEKKLNATRKGTHKLEIWNEVNRVEKVLARRLMSENTLKAFFFFHLE